MINISLDETYHIKDAKPLYQSRYKRVMSFHDGIAPVETDVEAFFIDINNKKLFNRVFIKCYGFYENLAAVKEEEGWFHIDINGNDIYKERYSWVGNFNEERCAVRDFNNNYFHIDSSGKRVYLENYNYVGDYRYSIAVVVNKKGKATHIDKCGDFLHGKFFDELNIFHKGYAIAKDKDGYFHIDKQGQELYKKRYQKLEDFYNGCAFATTFENEKVVLNESDFTQLQITRAVINKDKILDEIFKYFKYQILFAILKLDILKKIEKNSKINLPEISKKLIFRWLYVESIIDKNKQLTELGKVIEKELKPLILYWQDLPFKSSAYMVETLKEGDEYFSKIFKKPYFDFLQDSLEYAKLFKFTCNYYTFDYIDLVKSLNLRNEIICDIGAGDGNLMNMIQNYYPNVETIIADKFVDSSKNSVKIDFFKSFKIDADIFLLSRVLHDWNDDKALKILKNISENMNKSTTLYIFETIVPEDTKIDKGVTLSFHLLNFVGGYERTLNEFNRLFQKENLRIVEVFEKDKLISLIKVCKI